MSIESNMVNELDKIVKEITELFKKYNELFKKYNELLVELKKEETVTYGPVYHIKRSSILIKRNLLFYFEI